MSPPEQTREPHRPGYARTPRYGRYLWLLAIVIIILLTVNRSLTKSSIHTGVQPGRMIPPFALPLATATSTAMRTSRPKPTRARPAMCRPARCANRASSTCASFTKRVRSCSRCSSTRAPAPRCSARCRQLASSFPGVQLAGVAIKGQRESLRKLIAQRGLSDVQVGFDHDGALASLYQVVSCPQVTFVLPGGTAQSAPLLSTPTTAQLRARISTLVAAARARGWRPPG